MNATELREVQLRQARILHERNGHDCRCGSGKRRGQTFCRPCLNTLPTHIRLRLNRTMTEGYELAYDEATRNLFPEAHA